MKKDIVDLIDGKEKILFEGKPEKICFILECIFNPFLPFAILWGLFDIFLFTTFLNSTIHTFEIILILFHMLPVWIYLFGALMCFI